MFPFRPTFLIEAGIIRQTIFTIRPNHLEVSDILSIFARKIIVFSKNINNNLIFDIMEKKSLSKTELIEQLKAIANDETEVTMSMGAMCYSPACPEPKKVKCESCNKEISEMSWMSPDENTIRYKVQVINELGYDAKVERLCSDCATKLGLKEEDGDPLGDDCLYYVFYFKTKEQNDYNIAIANSEDEYDAVIAFLKNERTYKNYYDATCLIKDELPLIKRMTGISIE